MKRAGQPLVVAHRGASADEAEHTLAAYLRAIDDGADAVECDVRLTRDGVLVCVHDRRVDRTSSGSGPVSTLGLAELAELDFGSWRGDLGDDRAPSPDWEDSDRTAVLTLERLVEAVLQCGRPVDLAIETKHPTRYAGLVELTLAELLHRHGLDRPREGGAWPVRVMSFAPTSLRRVHELAPGVPTVLLMRRLAARMRAGALPPRVPIAGPSLELLRARPSYVRRVHRAGHQVHVWTVDEPADVDFVTALGVDAIITNRPRETLALLGR